MQAVPESQRDSNEQAWKIIGLIILSLRFVQGWIFWGGGSRRFIYAPQKLDPHAHEWMANKFQSAMPGALLGVDHIISFMLQHFYLLYVSIIIFSLIELLCGIALIFGFCARITGLVTALLSIVLMLTFGWQGATCMDEWTMAVSNLAMGLTLALSGASLYSVDYWLLRKYPLLRQKNWFNIISSGPVPFVLLQRASIAFLIFTVFFTVATYNHFRGAVWSAYHAGPVSPTYHHITLSDGHTKTDGTVVFTAYVDAGTPALPSNIIRIELIGDDGKAAEIWEGKDLSQMKKSKIKNDYLYNRFVPGQYGLVAPMSAMATIELPPMKPDIKLPPGKYLLEVYTINGNKFELELGEDLSEAIPDSKLEEIKSQKTRSNKSRQVPTEAGTLYFD